MLNLPLSFLARIENILVRRRRRRRRLRLYARFDGPRCLVISNIFAAAYTTTTAGGIGGILSGQFGQPSLPLSFLRTLGTKVIPDAQYRDETDQEHHEAQCLYASYHDDDEDDERMMKKTEEDETKMLRPMTNDTHTQKKTHENNFNQ